MSRASRSGSTVERLTRRAEYLAAAKGRRHHTPRVSLQAAERPQPDPAGEAPRFGLTASRKVGNAVERNRVKRRLRAALRELAGDPVAGPPGRSHFDYVVVARREVLAAPFADLVDDLRDGLTAIHRPRSPSRPRRGSSTDRPARPPESH